jgi:hypothetical protein
MNEPELKDLAFKIAETAPRHLDKPTSPPIHWQKEGNVLRVLLADGRTVRGPIPSVGSKRAKYPEGALTTPARTNTEGAGVMALPVRSSGASGTSGTSIKPQTPQRPQVPYKPQKP